MVIICPQFHLPLAGKKIFRYFPTFSYLLKKKMFDEIFRYFLISLKRRCLMIFFNIFSFAGKEDLIYCVTVVLWSEEETLRLISSDKGRHHYLHK